MTSFADFTFPAQLQQQQQRSFLALFVLPISNFPLVHYARHCFNSPFLMFIHIIKLLCHSFLAQKRENTNFSPERVLIFL